MKIHQKYAAILTGMAIITSLALAVPAFAQTNAPANVQGGPQGAWSGHWQGGTGGAPGIMRGTPPAAVGQVTAINGTTLTVTGHTFPKPTGATSGSTGGTVSKPVSATVTYTIDASNATVKKNNATSTVSAIAVGDFVMVQGTTNGTTITATSIRDGMMMRGGPNGKTGPPGTPMGSGASSPIQGNGQPVVAGTVSNVSGTTLTVSTKSNVTYTVDATNAKVVQGNSTVTLSSVTTGDSVIVQGTVNGTAIVASTVIDNKAPTNAGSGSSQPHPGFFGSIGQFFSHLFGF